jgi:SAM-dependent methyltransferase
MSVEVRKSILRRPHEGALTCRDAAVLWQSAWVRESSPDPAQYDTFAAAYAEHAALASHNAMYDRPSTLRLLGQVEGKRVLDAACGPGLYIEELLKRGARVVGCDAAPAMIELARRRVGDDVRLHVHSLDDPFAWIDDDAFDIVLCALAYHYVSNRLGFLSEIRRILRDDGFLVISTHHPTADWCRLGGSYFQLTSVTETWSKGWRVTAWRMPLRQLAEEFAATGFVIERLVEPAPDPAMADSHPEDFEKLSREPGFIAFRLRKDPRWQPN